jgi:hypothetical protein
MVLGEYPAREHAEIAAIAGPARVVTQPAPAVAHDNSGPAYAGVTNPLVVEFHQSIRTESIVAAALGNRLDF